MDAPLGPHVLTEDDHARVACELDVQRATNRRLHVDASTFRMRRGGRGCVTKAVGCEAALLLHLGRAVRSRFGEDISRDAGRVRMRPRKRLGNGLRDIVTSLPGDG